MKLLWIETGTWTPIVNKGRIFEKEEDYEEEGREEKEEDECCFFTTTTKFAYSEALWSMYAIMTHIRKL